MKNKRIIVISLIGFIVCLTGFIVVTSLYFNKNKDEKQEEVSYVSKVSDISFINVSESINLGEVMPLLDKFGILNDGFSFTLKNSGNDEKQYTLSLWENESTIVNKMVRYELIKKEENLGIHTLNDEGIIDIGKIKPNEEINYTIKLWLDYNSDIKVGSLNKKIMVSEDVDYFDKSHANSPILTEGMIPVYYDYETSSFRKASIENTFYGTWYDYSKDLYANTVTVKSEKRKEYMDSEIGTRISLSDINSIWVWIPRFNYQIENGKATINYVDINSDAHSSFMFNNQKLEGFWVSKYETGISEDDECFKYSFTSRCNSMNNEFLFKPNIPIMNRITMSNLFYGIRKMELNNNIYGFKGNGIKVNNDGTINSDDNNMDIHMIRNSEWDALSILSINNELSPNNTNQTGMSWYNDKNYNFDVSYGMKASINGNVTGVYDMLGGRCEYVMLYSDDLFTRTSTSGFTSSINEMYYDKEIDNNLKEYIKTEKIQYPASRGGYKDVSKNVFSYCNISDYVDKVSLETNTRAVLSILREDNNEKNKES